MRTKTLAVNNAQKMVLDESVKLHDAETYAQMRSYVYRGNGKYGNSDDTEYDDNATAWIISCEVMLETNDELANDERNREARNEEMIAQVNEYAEMEAAGKLAPKADGAACAA
jgi:hypothetical protein